MDAYLNNHKLNVSDMRRHIDSVCLVQLIFSLAMLAPAQSQSAGNHLFILSGQSNMAGLNPEDSFTPAVAAAFGADKVFVVKDAKGGEPIRKWYKAWKPAEGNEPKATGDLYDRLMGKVEAVSHNRSFESVTFIWMQGERDAREEHGLVYEHSLLGLYEQLSKDLERRDINFVIGRLSDFDLDNARYPHWTMVREAQVKVADGCARCVWVDTDDLNDGVNRAGKAIKDDLHYSVTGYEVLGQRFARKAIMLIEQNAN